jgi:ubiquitin C-terminal hydrolase
VYDLYGYIFHKGEHTYQGHYFSIVKTQCSAPHKKGKWIACDDSKIQEITDKEESWFRKRAYIFFYQQRVK